MWLATQVTPGAASHALPRLWQWIYEHDDEVRHRFPDVWGADYDEFSRWALREGAETFGVSERFTLPLRRRVLKRAQDAEGNACMRAVSESQQDGINVTGHFSSEKGVGEAVRSAVRILNAAAIPYVLNNFVDPGSANSDTTFVHYDEGTPYAVNLITLGAGEIPWFASQRRDDYFRSRHTIGHWAWELADFPQEWSSSFPYFDEIWVASSFVRDALTEISPVPVFTVPYTVTGELPPESTHRLHFGLPRNAFIFLTVFDFDSYTERKNPLGTIRAFTQAFSPDEPVFLLVKCVHSHVAPGALRAVQVAARGANVRISDGILPRSELRRLFGIADCYVSLHRAEGFGLTIAEAMSIGKPVIATGYSGNMEFMDPANSFPCEYRLVPIAETCGPYQRGFVWADPDLDHAATLMRHVYEHPDVARGVGEQARRDILARFTPAAVGVQMRARYEAAMNAVRSRQGYEAPAVAVVLDRGALSMYEERIQAEAAQ